MCCENVFVRFFFTADFIRMRVKSSRTHDIFYNHINFKNGKKTLRVLLSHCKASNINENKKQYHPKIKPNKNCHLTKNQTINNDLQLSIVHCAKRSSH